MSEDSALDRAKAEVDEMIGGRTLEERAMAGEGAFESVPTESVPTELWTPPEKLTSNEGRMAWAMFLKWWKVALEQASISFSIDQATERYRHCIAVAKALEEINQDPGKTDG